MKHEYKVGDWVVCTETVEPKEYAGTVTQVCEVQPRIGSMPVAVHPPTSTYQFQRMPMEYHEIRPALPEEVLAHKLTL